MSKIRNWIYRHPIRIVFSNALLLILMDILHRFSARIGFPGQILDGLMVFACVYFVCWGILLPVIGIRRIRKNQTVSDQETLKEIQVFLLLVILPPLMAISAFLFY